VGCERLTVVWIRRCGAVRERERERDGENDGNVNCSLVKVQGLRLSDIVWGVEGCNGRTVDEMVVMVWWS
jgi:hypothetical protein